MNSMDGPGTDSQPKRRSPCGEPVAEAITAHRVLPPHGIFLFTLAETHASRWQSSPCQLEKQARISQPALNRWAGTLTCRNRQPTSSGTQKNGDEEDSQMPKMTSVSPNVETMDEIQGQRMARRMLGHSHRSSKRQCCDRKPLCDIAGKSRDTQEQQCSRLPLSQGILKLRHANELHHISFSMVRRSHQTQTGCSRRPRPKHRCSPQAPHNFARNPNQKHKACRHKLVTTPCALWIQKARRISRRVPLKRTNSLDKTKKNWQRQTHMYRCLVRSNSNGDRDPATHPPVVR